MNLTDDQLVRSVRESVAARPGAGVPVEEIIWRGRRRTAVRRGVLGSAVAALVVGAVAVSVVGFPLLSSAPPARQPSITLTPDPSRTTALRPATDMYARGDSAIVRAGLPLSDDTARWDVGRGNNVWYGGSPGAPDDILAGTAGPGFALEIAHLTAPRDPGATPCSEVSQEPVVCVREPQDDGSVLFELRVDGEQVQYLLLHRTGFVRVYGMGPLPPEAGPTDPFEPADPEQLRTLVLDPALRW